MRFEIEVGRGAAWLDANLPGWYRRINLKQLDMAAAIRFSRDETGCVLCQLYGNYYGALGELSKTGADSWTHGFTVGKSNGDKPKMWQELEDQWRKRIQERLDAEVRNAGASGSDPAGPVLCGMAAAGSG